MPPVKAAWLHGNLRDNPGVLGLGHCARLERFGDNLRWILDANHPSSALTNAGSKGAQPALSAQQMLATAGKLDLVNNVFQNGVHGSLRNTIVEVRRRHILEQFECSSFHICSQCFACHTAAQRMLWSKKRWFTVCCREITFLLWASAA